MTPLQLTFTWPDTAIELAIILVVAVVTRWILVRLIRRVTDSISRKPKERYQDLGERAEQVMSYAAPVDTERSSKRAKTLGSVLRSVTDFTIIVMAVLSMLKTLNINIGPAIASAGIGGIAIGFGAQSLVKDVISGLFLIIEDQFGVGDYVTIGDLQGTITAIQLRTTQLRDAGGQIWYVRNGEIITLGNKSQGWSETIVEIPTSMSEDPFRVIELLDHMCASLDKDPEFASQMLEAPNTLGLMRFDATTATYGVHVKCPGNKQWAVEREIRARAIVLLREAGIRVPAQLIRTVDAAPEPMREKSVERATPPNSALRETILARKGYEQQQREEREALAADDQTTTALPVADVHQGHHGATAHQRAAANQPDPNDVTTPNLNLASGGSSQE